MINILKLLLLLFLTLIVTCGNAQNDFPHESIKWSIQSGQLIRNSSIPDRQATTYWNFINALLPSAPLEKYVTTLRLYSDGLDEDLGGMTSTSFGNSTWEIDLDTIDVDLSRTDSVYMLDYLHTIIHEFGHLITLNAEQIIATEDKFQDDAMGYLTSEGYADANSYLGKFVKAFWQKELLEEWDRIDRMRAGNRKDDYLFGFYEAHKSRFLSDYAAESPEEDIAEAWTFFVFDNEPSKSNGKYAKVKFFYQFPELVAYRKQIRKQLPLIPGMYIQNYVNKGWEE